MLPILTDDNDLWTTIHDADGNPIMGVLYYGRIYHNFTIPEFRVRYSNRNCWSTPVVKRKNGCFKFQSDVKCMVCNDRMEVTLKFIDHNASYCFDTEKSNERVCFTVVINEVKIGHQCCMTNVMTRNGDFIFIIQELRMSFLKWWHMLTLEKQVLFFALCVMICFMVCWMIQLICYMNVYNPEHFWICAIIFLSSILICMVIWLIIFKYLKRNTYLNGYCGTRKALRLGIRKNCFT